MLLCTHVADVLGRSASRAIMSASGAKSLLTPTAVRISRATREVDPVATESWRQQAIALIIYPAARLLPYFLRPNRRLISSLEKDSGAKSPSHPPGFELDTQAGVYRIGVGAVVIPEVNAWKTSSKTIREVTAWLIQRSVDHHPATALAPPLGRKTPNPCF
jgi:hypothetical protein